MTTWTVPGLITAVHDGDTVTADLSLGWYTWVRGWAIRLAHANAPELATPAGKAARDFVQALLPLGAPILVVSHSVEKFGRILGSIQLPDGRDLATVLVAEGLAVPYEGGLRR